MINRAQGTLNTRFAATIEEVVALEPDLVFEAAGHAAVRAYARSVLAAGIDLALMSVGALADPDLRRDLVSLATLHGAALLIPSGAIGGLDVLRASRAQGQLCEVRLTSTKRPAALVGQPYIAEPGIRLEDLHEPLIVFEGTAAEACLAFPKSTNIAAAVSLSGLGFNRTHVRVVADPHTRRTVHMLEARGGFGEMRLKVRNFAHPRNPRTSFLACLGSVAAVENVQGPLRFI